VRIGGADRPAERTRDRRGPLPDAFAAFRAAFIGRLLTEVRAEIYHRGMAAPATRVFISAVSGEFRSYRLRLANHLGAVRDRSFEVKVQEDFQQGGRTLLDRLSDYIRDCDVVIHLVGDACGARPTPQHERTLYRHLGETPPDPLPGWSYTQWEYRLALRFDRRVLVYLAQPQAPRDSGLPIRQGEDEARLQQAHQEFLNQSGQHWKSFGSLHHLVREVFHDLALEPGRKVNNLPYKSLGSLFKGREEFLERIRAALGQVDHRGHQRFAAITATATAAAVYGLGGIGKTRAAIEYAHRHAEEYTALLFVRADSPAALKRELAGLCGPLVLNLPEQSERETEIQVAAALRWLEGHPGWFLIFDGVDSEEAARAVEDLLGRLHSAGQVLVTSRLSGWSGAVETLDLDVLAAEDAVAFLLERTDGRRRPMEDDAARAGEVATELGQLALALEQAGAYIATRRLTFGRYLEEWRAQHERVLAWFDERQMQYPRSVATTWQMSFEQLTPSARRLLCRFAWLGPEPIPESLLDVPLPARGIASRVAADPHGDLAGLERYSLVTRTAEEPSFTVHRLVQDVTRCSLRRNRGRRALSEALHWLNAAFVGDPQDVRTWSRLVPLAPHVRAVAQRADHEHVAEPTARLMNVLGLLFGERAQHAEAEPLMRRAVENLIKFTRRTGRQHPHLGATVKNYENVLTAMRLGPEEVRRRLNELQLS